LSVFEKNYEDILSHDAEKMGFTKGVTQFSDWTTEEFQKIKGARFDKEAFESMEKLEFNESTPVSNGIDWRNSGIVTGVKNQG